MSPKSIPARRTIVAALGFLLWSTAAAAQQYVISTYAGGGPPGNGSTLGSFSGDGGPATSARLNGPSGVAVDDAGNLFIADRNNHRIRKVSPSGIITTVAGNGSSGFSGDGGPATSAQLSAPIGPAVDSAGNLFFADSDNNRVRRVSPGGTITTVAGNGTRGFSGDGGPATSAALSYHSGYYGEKSGGVAVDSTGNLFIADFGNYRVRKVSPSGILTTVAGGGDTIFSDGGQATSAALGPTGVVVDGAGNLFIADSWFEDTCIYALYHMSCNGFYGRIRKVSPSGIITTVAGTGLVSSFGDSGPDGPGPATSAYLYAAVGVAVDGAGNLFIAHPGSFFPFGDYPRDVDHRIRKVSPDGIITTLAGKGTGFSGDGGPAATAALSYPTGVAVDRAGNVYVADFGNNVVRILRPTGRSVFISAVVDAASQLPDPVSPGKIVVLYGAGLGSSELLQNQPSSAGFGTVLGGTAVSFNGIAAPVLYASATQVAAIVPYAITGATAQVTVSYQGQGSDAFTVPVAASAPSLFTLNQTGVGQAAAINAVDGTVNTAANPVKIGGFISLYATGEGQTTPGGLDGRIAGSTPTRPVLPVTVTVGGIPATVQYAGGAPGQVAGLMQVNVQVPSGVQPGGYVPVVLQVGDRASGPGVWIAVGGS